MENVDKTYTDPQTGKFKPGNPGGGRPEGQRNYATIYKEALRKIAESKDMTPDELEELIEQTGIENALKGNYNFFKDIRDRVHGKATDKLDVTSGGEPLGVVILPKKDEEDTSN